MLKNDFYGNNFTWWTGIVESRKDPLKLGQVQVRIFGIHPFLSSGSPDRSAVSTDNLPWAHAVHPMGFKTPVGAKLGDWVMGFFEDGPNAQRPVIMGSFGGIESKAYKDYTENPAAKETNPPKPPDGIVTRVIGEPTVSRLARGIYDGTMVQRMNNELTYACDPGGLAYPLIAKTITAFSIIAQAIRSAKNAILEALGLDPSGLLAYMKQLLSYIKAGIDWLMKILDDISKIQNFISTVMNRIQELADFIKDLPAKLKQALQNCINKLMAAISDSLSGLIGDVGFDFSIITQVNDVINKSKEIISNNQQIEEQAKDLSNFPKELADAYTDIDTSLNASLTITDWLSITYDSQEETKTKTAFTSNNYPGP